jgi:hypothetical protein
VLESKSTVVGPASPHILETEIDGDTSLYNPKTEQVTILNGSASDIWRLADGGHTVEEIIDLLASSYQVKADSIAADVETTIADLSEAGLIDSP